MNNKSMFLERNGLKLHYKVMGEGKPIIFLNPAFSDLRIWDNISRSLSKFYRVIQFDFRYTGKTEQDSSDYRMFEDLNYLVEELELNNVNLIGLSAGAHTALEYATQYPDKVGMIFIMSTGLFGVAEDEAKVRLMEEFQSNLYTGNIEEAACIWTNTWLVGKNRSKTDISCDKFNSFKEITMYNLLNRANFKMPCFTTPPLNSQLSKINSEVYHLVGCYDYEDVNNASGVLKDNIDKYEEEQVNAAHVIPLELGELVISRVLDFIN